MAIQPQSSSYEEAQYVSHHRPRQYFNVLTTQQKLRVCLTWENCVNTSILADTTASVRIFPYVLFQLIFDKVILFWRPLITFLPSRFIRKWASVFFIHGFSLKAGCLFATFLNRKSSAPTGQMASWELHAKTIQFGCRISLLKLLSQKEQDQLSQIVDGDSIDCQPCRCAVYCSQWGIETISKSGVLVSVLWVIAGNMVSGLWSVLACLFYACWVDFYLSTKNLLMVSLTWFLEPDLVCAHLSAISRVFWVLILVGFSMYLQELYFVGQCVHSNSAHVRFSEIFWQVHKLILGGTRILFRGAKFCMPGQDFVKTSTLLVGPYWEQQILNLHACSLSVCSANMFLCCCIPFVFTHSQFIWAMRLITCLVLLISGIHPRFMWRHEFTCRWCRHVQLAPVA